MIQSSTNGLGLFKFPNLSACPDLIHGVFTRHGGNSPPPFDSLNMSDSAGDRPENVERNRAAVSACCDGLPLIFLNQVHGDEILVFSRDEPAPDPTGKRQGDAMITNRPGLMLAVKLADCQGVLLHDPDKKVTAAVHSGWRGSVADIIGKTIDRMKTEFGCRPGDILAGISPSLGPCCAEFVNYKKELPAHFRPYKDGRDHFDFWQISRAQMTAAGIPENNIEIAAVCTSCRTDLFYSYRKEGRTGRFTVVAGMVKSSFQVAVNRFGDERGQGHDGDLGIDAQRGGHRAAVGYIKVPDIIGFTAGTDCPPGGVGGHAA